MSSQDSNHISQFFPVFSSWNVDNRSKRCSRGIKAFFGWVLSVVLARIQFSDPTYPQYHFVYFPHEQAPSTEPRIDHVP